MTSILSPVSSRTYKIVDYVDVKMNSTVHKGMPHQSRQEHQHHQVCHRRRNKQAGYCCGSLQQVTRHMRLPAETIMQTDNEALLARSSTTKETEKTARKRHVSLTETILLA
uniref:Uncharacterized protein n=1 Tax=Zea mays TaxID=4577 RepID=A0A804MFH1_MAIZE